MILGNVSVDELRDAARRYGMVSLRDAGTAFMYEGVTTPDEVIRETIVDA
jgi:type IV pilus assembly protein PilB